MPSGNSNIIGEGSSALMLEKVNLKSRVEMINNLYVYEKIGKVNEDVISVANVENRTLEFHVHEKSDELFYVIEGSFCLETEEGLIELKEGELIIVPKGVRHRPVVKELVKVMLIELDGTLNKENSGEI